MKKVLLLAALFVATHCAAAQTNSAPMAADTNTPEQVENQPVYQQLHNVPPSPPPSPTPPPATAQEGAGKASTSERWKYDPAARRGDGEQRLSNESGIERALKGINPCNVPYGGLLAEWRIAVVKETIENIYYWALIFLSVSLMLATSYISWLLHQREARLHIAGGVVAQLWNAHVFARHKALEAIEAHNKLVTDLNAADAGAEEQSSQAAIYSVPTMSSGNTSNAPGATASSPTNTRDKSALAWAEAVFEEPQKSTASVSKEIFPPQPLVDKKDAGDSVPLWLRAARWQETRQQQPFADTPMPEMATATEITPEAAPDPDKETGTSEAEDIDVIKLALQEAKQALAAKDAQITTKDAQLRAKDDKITSQRQLVSDLNNKLKASGTTGSGAN